MLKKIILEVKNEDEALKQAVEKLRVNASYIKLTLSSEKKGFLGLGSSKTYEATINQNLGLLGKDFIEKILSNLNVEYKMEFRTLQEGKQIVYNLETSENALIIGRNGSGLEGLQTLLKAFLNQFTNEKLIVNLDVGGYRQKRIKMLEIMATKTAKEVLQTGQEISLSNLNSFERRIIHTKLSDWKDIETISSGEGEDRKLVIKHR